MINNILQLLQQQGMPPQPNAMQNPGMMMASNPQPYHDDVGVNPMNINDIVSRIEGLNQGPQVAMGEPNLGDPRTISGRIQEWLGAKKPNEQGMVGDILSQRFQPQNAISQMGLQQEPSLSDVSQGAVQTFFAGGKPVSGQNVSDERVKGNLEQQSILAKMQYLAKGGGSGSVFAQTMDAINSDPDLADLSMMDKIRLAQNKLGTNLTMGANGQVNDMGGAAESLGNLAHGQKLGSQNAILDTERDITREGAIGKAEGEKQGSAASNLPSVEQNTAYSQKILQDLVSHPGLHYAQGAASYAPLIRGTSRADFEALRRQVGGTAFLQAFQSLKGGGAISNVEGEKATEAITRIMDQSLSPDDFVKAANDLNNILNIGLQRAKGEAQGNFNQTFSPDDFNQQNLGGSGATDWQEYFKSP